MCSRRQRIQNDVDAVIQRCEAERECPFSDFTYADAVFAFTYSGGAKRICYYVNVSDDYPDNTIVTNSENADSVSLTKDPIPVIFQGIAQARLKEAVGDRPSKKPRPQTETNRRQTSDDSDEAYSDGPEEEEDSEGDRDCYGRKEENSDGESQKHPQLEADLRAVRALKGARAATLREYSGFDDADIELHIDVQFLDAETAQCWGVKRSDPVTIRLNLSLTQYLDGTVPKVDVFQDVMDRDKFALRHQIKKIMQTFVSEQWAKGTGKATTSAPTTRYNLLGLKNLSSDAKSVPRRHKGFLVQVIEYAEQRIPVLNEFCVICDEPHSFLDGPMIMPYVCQTELCIFAFQTLGVMSQVTDAIGTGAQVVDLLVSMARAALASGRRDLIFDPYPSVVDPDNPHILAINPKNKNYGRVKEAFDNLPAVRELVKNSRADMKKRLDQVDKLSLPLLQWVISSNRSHIAKLMPDNQLQFMKTPHQFLLLSSSPAREAKFREAREAHGSTFVFHGSGIENWHSIMRKGLIVASNTKYQMNGAAYGVGIYLSPNSSVSFGYCYSRDYWGLPTPTIGGVGNKTNITRGETNITRGGQGAQFLNSSVLNCIALCEVIKSPCLRKSHDIWVAPNANYVCTRFFFVYEDRQMSDPHINTQNPQIYDQILQVIKSRQQAAKGASTKR